MRLGDLKGCRVAVWGYGREGKAAVRKLRGIAGELIIADTSPDLMAPPEDESLEIVVGSSAVTALLSADVIVKSPGISPMTEIYQTVSESGPVITTGTNLWLEENHSRTIAITGTKGKSTTATMLGAAMANLGIAGVVAGNIGEPLLDAPSAEYYVVELSSYQCSSVVRSPSTVIFTSFFPEHLDWHGGIDRYRSDKFNVAMHGSKLVIANGYESRLREELPGLGPDTRTVWTGAESVVVDHDGNLKLTDGRIVPRDAIPAQGLHNARNAALAVVCLEELFAERLRGIAAEQIFRGFKPLDHRLQSIPSADGRTWIDDGLATAPEATVAALKTLADQDVTLIIGGADRGLSYDPLVDYLTDRQKRVVIITTGQSGPRMAAAVRSVDHHLVIETESFSDAMSLARNETPLGGTILLSPGAPSFGEFRDYVERGRAFAEFVSKLK